MTITQFQTVDLYRQVDFVYMEGVYLCEKDYSDLTILLYQIENFYVEMIRENETGRLHILSSFHSTQPLEPYLSQIDISELIEVLK